MFLSIEEIAGKDAWKNSSFKQGLEPCLLAIEEQSHMIVPHIKEFSSKYCIFHLLNCY